MRTTDRMIRGLACLVGTSFALSALWQVVHSAHGPAGIHALLSLWSFAFAYATHGDQAEVAAAKILVEETARAIDETTLKLQEGKSETLHRGE